MKIIGVRKFRQGWGDYINQCYYLDERFILTKNKRSAAVVISHKEWMQIEAMMRELDKLRELKEGKEKK